MKKQIRYRSRGLTGRAPNVLTFNVRVKLDLRHAKFDELKNQLGCIRRVKRDKREKKPDTYGERLTTSEIGTPRARYETKTSNSIIQTE